MPQQFREKPRHLDSAVAATRKRLSPEQRFYDKFWKRVNARAQKDIEWLETVHGIVRRDEED